REISSESNTEINPEFHVAFDNLYNAFGNWIYHQDGIVNLTQSNEQFEKVIEGKFDLICREVLEETKKTCRNITKFLQRL
ncbi:MAG: hypothetical protein ACFE9R_03350, partial [Candidatus Hermodarchaeota archaeon]